ncbi:MAG: N-acetyl-gamma-glutamyl-phosphate reductase [Magnetospiraceae bacterium]
MTTTARIAILGASGYTGAELIRHLYGHPHIQIAALTADRKAGMKMADVFPHLAHVPLPNLTALDEVNWAEIDVVFGCLPHGVMHDLVRKIPENVKVIDLSADFRLADAEVYKEWYGREHTALDLQKEAVYGIPEINRVAISKARIVAGPGCYPTSAQIPLSPLLSAGLIATDSIIIDAKSGVSGAGRATREGLLHTEVSEGFNAYGVAGHRHAPEIEQGLTRAAGSPIMVTFTPHLLPMNRGILTTIYVSLVEGTSADDLRTHLQKHYEGAPFVKILPRGKQPATRHVRGTNMLLISVDADRVPGRAIIIAAEDNLVKGASGQLVQCMNVMMGWPETTGLSQIALFP